MISVALCTYNGALFINQQLESIVNQTHPVDEIVVCDDRSTDDTVKIIESFASQHPSIIVRLIINDNVLGVRMNFEKALNTCNGDIKFLSDQDDIWFPNKVETIVEYFQTNTDKSVVFSNANLINSESKPYSKYDLFDCIGLDNNGLQLCDKGYYMNVFLTNGRAYGCTMAIRKEVVCKFDYPTKLYHDYILTIEAILNNNLGYIKEPLMQYRIHNEQTSGIGPSEIRPPKIYIYDIGHVDMQGYPSPPELQKEIDMRDLRFSFYILGLRGIPKIFLNYRKYKSNYKTEWKNYVRADIKRIIVRYKSTHCKK